MNDKKFAKMTKDWAAVTPQKLGEQIAALNVEVDSGKAELKPQQENMLARMMCRQAKVSGK